MKITFIAPVKPFRKPVRPISVDLPAGMVAHFALNMQSRLPGTGMIDIDAFALKSGVANNIIVEAAGLKIAD